jgi:hypothetical protein
MESRGTRRRRIQKTQQIVKLKSAAGRFGLRGANVFLMFFVACIKPPSRPTMRKVAMRVAQWHLRADKVHVNAWREVSWEEGSVLEKSYHQLAAANLHQCQYMLMQLVTSQDGEEESPDFY